MVLIWVCIENLVVGYEDGINKNLNNTATDEHSPTAFNCTVNIRPLTEIALFIGLPPASSFFIFTILMENSQNVKEPPLNAAEQKQNRTLRSLDQDELCRLPDGNRYK